MTKEQEAILDDLDAAIDNAHQRTVSLEEKSAIVAARKDIHDLIEQQNTQHSTLRRQNFRLRKRSRKLENGIETALRWLEGQSTVITIRGVPYDVTIVAREELKNAIKKK